MYTIKKNNPWLAAYLYYEEPWEEFLSNAIAPFVAEIIHQKLADQYFFIRYWEKGPHIRLRFKGDPNTLEKVVKPKLKQHFTKYFQQFPSHRNDPEWLKNAKENEKWHPNNTIQFIEYEPEIERYGGPIGITIAEKHFQYASNAILNIIQESNDWDYSRALGAAIQLHLGFAYALGMNLYEATHFFQTIFQSWLPRAYYFFEKDITQKELDKRKNETLNAFKINFIKQKENLLPFFDAVWNALNEKQEFEQEWLNKWVENLQETRTSLIRAQEKNNIIFPERWYTQQENSNISKPNQLLWTIYDSYIHMINNRLGILNRDEGYLGFLMKESLKLIK